MTLSHDKQLVASCSPDDIVKILDVSQLQHRAKDGSFDLEAYENTRANKPNHGKISKKAKQNSDDDWMSNSDSDSADGDCDDDSDSDSDDSMDGGGLQQQHKPKNKKLNPKNNTVGMSKKMLEQEKKKDFFKDM